MKEEFSSYEDYINGLAKYSYAMLGNGPVYTLKVGRDMMETKDLVKNIIRGAYGLIAHILGDQIGPEDVRQINIKTYNSPSLPVYAHLREEEIEAYNTKRGC